MSAVLLCMACLLLLCLLLGLVRVALGPTSTDSLLAAQLTSTVGVALLAVLSKALALPALIDVALVLALLTAVTSAAYVRTFGVTQEGSGE